MTWSEVVAVGQCQTYRYAKDMLKGTDKGVVVSVSAEICSATFQMADDLSLIISNAIFADGASASVLWRRPEGLELVAQPAVMTLRAARGYTLHLQAWTTTQPALKLVV